MRVVEFPGCYRCLGATMFEGAICECGAVADGRGGLHAPEPDPPARRTCNRHKDGEWGDDAETAPELWIACPLAMHSLVPDVDEDGAEVSRSHVTEYPDPVAALTAERDAAIAERDALRVEVARLSASKERLREVYECAVAPITRDRNGNPVYPHSWLRFDAAEFGRETPPFRLIPVWETPVGLLSDVPNFCDVVDDPGEVAPDNCPECGQQDVGQYGEYPCPLCGVPREWDVPVTCADPVTP